MEAGHVEKIPSSSLFWIFLFNNFPKTYYICEAFQKKKI